jgi:hypothetical protein
VANFGNDTIYPVGETLPKGQVRIYKVPIASSGSNSKVGLCVHDDSTGETFKVGLYAPGTDVENNPIFTLVSSVSEHGPDYKTGAVTNVPSAVPKGWHDIAIDGTQGWSYSGSAGYVGVLQPDGDDGAGMTCVEGTGNARDSWDSAATGLASLPVTVYPTNHLTDGGKVSAYGTN